MSTISTIKSTPSTSGPQPDPALQKAAQGFEAVFLREIIGSMRKAKLADDFLGSTATDQFRSMSDARTADEMAKIGAFGIAALLEKQFANSGVSPK